MVQSALAEDVGTGDVTTLALIEEAATVRARIVARESLVVAGVAIAEAVFRELSAAIEIERLASDGHRVNKGETLLGVHGQTRAILTGERVALNFLQRLSGIATATRRTVDAVAGTPARITHTRKTTPGLRALEQYAVRVGGGVDNRASLADAILWKDNHWALLARDGGRHSLAATLRGAPDGLPVIVEVESDAQLEEALAAGVTHLLVDNQSPERVAEWVKRAGPGITIQASGGITLENARAYAEAGAALLAIGALTHSVTAAPITCDIVND
jgi:nicotinate-nucleotide pyrophosphorylase (carboxylating)